MIKQEMEPTLSVQEKGESLIRRIDKMNRWRYDIGTRQVQAGVPIERSIRIDGKREKIVLSGDTATKK